VATGLGNERNMARCEQEKLPYLFKASPYKNVRRAAEKMERVAVVGCGQKEEAMTKLRLEDGAAHVALFCCDGCKQINRTKLISTPSQMHTNLFWVTQNG